MQKFDDSMVGKIEGVKIKLHVDDKAKPVFKKACPVPFAIRMKYEESLDKLEEQGIIEEVEFSPVVPVKKANGDIRLCGDYCSTIKKHIIRYMENILQNLISLKHFINLNWI